MKKITYTFKLLLLLSLTVFFNTVFWSTWETIEDNEILIINESDIELNSAYSWELNNIWELNNTWVLNNSWNLNDQNKTIKELNSEVKRLDKERVTANIKIYKLKSLTSISDFLKDDLSEIEISELKDITYTYNQHKEELEKRFKEESESLNEIWKIEKQLIENKKDIYKELIPYIKKEKFKEYLDFIKNDVLALKETTQIKDNTIKKNIILKEKVENIKEKIIEHKETISEKLKALITLKVNEKVNNFKLSERFKELELYQKEELIKKMIYKTDEVIESLSLVEYKTTVLIQKIEIYKLIKEKLEELLLEL